MMSLGIVTSDVVTSLDNVIMQCHCHYVMSPLLPVKQFLS